MAAMAVALALAIDLVTSKGVGHDLGAYILAARSLAAGEAVYPAGAFTLGPFGHFVYPPPVALLFVPLAALPFDVARVLWLAALGLLAAAVILFLARELRPSVRYWACAGMILFFPLGWELTLGNLTLVTLVCCLVAWRARGWASATGLAAAVGLKLLAAPLVPFFAAAGRGTTAVRSVVVCAAVAVVTLPALADDWAPFVAVLATIARSEPGQGSNIVPSLFAWPLLRPLLPLLGLALVIACGAAARRGGAAADHAFRVALAALPLFASTLWYPYLLLALPLLAADAPAPPGRLRTLFRLARPLAWLLMQAQVVRDPGRDFILPLVGLLLLLAAGALEVRSALRATAPDRTVAPRLAAATA